jgi:3-isopropylmalate/(R)-2-methylmalate dehydratase small subunit
MDRIKGKAWVFGDDINTDLIYPNKYKQVALADPYKMAEYAMVGADPDFPKKIAKGDLIVAHRNFGCGSSREQAPTSIKYAGIGAVIAKSYGRIFYRNSINIGLPPLICSDADKIETGDVICVNFFDGNIYNDTKKEKYLFTPFPEFLNRILQTGGLIAYGKEQLKNLEEE